MKNDEKWTYPFHYMPLSLAIFASRPLDNLDLLKMRLKNTKNIHPNGGLMVIYHGKKVTNHLKQIQDLHESSLNKTHGNHCRGINFVSEV